MPDLATINVADGLREETLACYKPHCRYLCRATVEHPLTDSPNPPFLARVNADFEIPASCYIDDTGHLNSVEFNICYNQMLYVLLSQCAVDGLVPAMGAMTLQQFRRHQLPDVLIHEIHSVFKSPIDPRSFHGQLTFVAAADKKRFILLQSSCRFHDGSGGRAEGDVSVVIKTERTGQAAETRD